MASPLAPEKVQTLPDVFDFEDANAFAKEWIAEQRKRSHGFTLSDIAAKVGFSTPTGPWFILEKGRSIGLDKEESFAKLLRLKGDRRKYFERLVKLKHATSERDQQRIRMSAQTLKQQSRERELLSHQQLGMYRKLSYPVIRSMRCLNGFQEDPKWISERLNLSVSEEEVIEGIALLKALKLWHDGSVETKSEEDRPSEYPAYCRQLFENLAKSVNQVKREDREIRHLTIDLPRSRMKAAKERIKKFHEELNEEFKHDEKSDAVVTFVIAMVPVTKT